MKSIRNSAVNFVILLVVLSLCTTETNAERKVLRGRRTLTRNYIRESSLPGWAVILIVAVVYLVLGAVLYLALNKIVLQSPLENVNSYAPAAVEDRDL